MKILAVDPGLFSGVAEWDSARPRSLVTREIPYHEIGDDIWHYLRSYSGCNEQVDLVLERYTMRPGPKTSQPEALKIMGTAEWMANHFDVQLHYYLPDVTKRMISGAFLRRMQWYRATKDGHANDGARLVLTHLSRVDTPLYAEFAGI